jgi:D-lactate dehydrogenase (cytochrome)
LSLARNLAPRNLALASAPFTRDTDRVCNNFLTGDGKAMFVSSQIKANIVSTLLNRFGNRCATGDAVREQHANTLTWTENQPPDCVVYPLDTGEVQEIVRLCAAHDMPIIPFGTGTSFEGHVNAPYGGVSIDTSLMNKVLAVHAEDLDCVIEPGVTRKALNQELKTHGLFFPIDPGADASLGGMTATRASGTNAVRYGTMKDNVLNLTAVLPNGDLLKTAQRAKKSSAGYDLTRLFVGSEGTLGVITEITLKLHGIPEAISAGICPFPSIKAACDATILTIQSGIPIARIELLDEVQVRAINLHSKLSLPETPMLMVEFHGSETGVKEQAERFGEIAAMFEGGPFTWETKQEERTRLWQARHDAYWASQLLRPGCKGISTDVCVPISRLAECVEETKADLDSCHLIGPIVGHVGDGNFHVLPLIDMDDSGEVARGRAFVQRLVERAIRMEGTCTGEHGVGQAKMKYLESELGSVGLAALRAIKTAFDPRNVMNPGKIVTLST